MSAASRSTAGAGASSAGVGVEGGGGDEEDGGSHGDILSAVTLRSLRTARDRGDVKYKARKKKPIKTEASPSPSSSAAAPAPGTSGGGGGDPRGGQKLLRLSKLLADRAIGTRSEVRISDGRCPACS